MTVKNYFLRLCSLVILLTITLNCSEDDDNPSAILQEENTRVQNAYTFEVLPYNNVPGEVLTKAKKVIQKNSSTNLAARGTVLESAPPFGEIVRDSVHKITYEGRTTYTYKLEKKSPGLYYDNLLVVELADGRSVEYKMRYRPEYQWHARQIAGKSGFDTYTGSITIVDPSTQSFTYTTYDEGVAVKRQNERGELDKKTTVTATRGDWGDPTKPMEPPIDGGDTGTQIDLDEVVVTAPGGGGGGPTITPPPGPIPSGPITDTPNSPPPIGVGGSNGGGGGNGAPTTPPELDEYDKIENHLKEKEKCLHDLLTSKGTSYIKNIFSQFKGESEFDLRIISKDKVVTQRSGKVNGRTLPPKAGIIQIEISTSQAKGNPALEVVRTIIHEYIHADMFRKLKTKYPAQEELDFRDTFKKYGEQRFAETHHKAMADLYINSMKNVLKDFHKMALTGDYDYLTDNGQNPLPDEFYEALAWRGLKEDAADIYEGLSESKKKAMEEALNKHYHSTTKNCPEQ